MTDCLFLPADCGSQLDDECPLYWLTELTDGLSLSLAECAQRLQGQAVSLVLPMEVVSAFLVRLPTQKARWIRQALPYAVEDMLAEDVELFHLALGEQLVDGRYRVLATRRSLLAGWLEQLAGHGVLVTAIYVDADLLPREGEQVLFLGTRALIGGSSEARCAFQAQLWPQLQGFCEAPTLLHDLDDPYRLLAAGRVNAINLAQGEFAGRSENQAWTAWRPFCLVLGAWLMLQLGFNLLQAWQLERQADIYTASSLALYKELFPEDKRIVNLKAQFAEHLSQGVPLNAGFIGMLERASAVLAQAKSELEVEQVDYNQNRGDLALQVHAKDFSELEQLRQSLVEAGLTVQLGSASREEQGVTARVVLGLGGGV